MTLIHSRAAFRDFAGTLLRRQGTVGGDVRLPEGLSLVFERVPDGCRTRWKLALVREAFQPTSEEVEACCIAFQVPPSVTERRMERFRPHSKSGRRMHHHIVELTWHVNDEGMQAHGTITE